MPERLSAADPFTDPTGATTISPRPANADDGPVASMFRPVTDPIAELAALSTASPLTDWLAPSLLKVKGLVHDATPDRASPHVHRTVTAALYHPFALGARSGAPLMVGSVRSMLMPETATVAVLPAASVAVPLTDWLPPSPDSVWSAGQSDKPEPPSVQVKWKVTGAPYQP